MAASQAFRASSSAGLLTGESSSQLSRRSDRPSSSSLAHVSGDSASGSLSRPRLVCCVALSREANARPALTLRTTFLHRERLEHSRAAVWCHFVGRSQPAQASATRSPAPGVACGGRQPGLRERHSIRFDPLRAGHSNKPGEMATMTLPRALVEDTPQALPLFSGDLEEKRRGRRSNHVVRASGDGYGTFDGRDSKSYQDGSYQEASGGTEKGAYEQWNNLTARLADSATAAFLLLQLPQIVLNTQNLLAGNYVALSAIPWMGQLTGLLGNLSLLSYFAGKRERGAMVVQAVGVMSTLAVLMQLEIAGAMPRTAFTVTASAVVIGLSLNFFNYKGLLSPKLWKLWEETVSVAGITVLPQVMWSTFQPYLPPSMLPALLFGGSALTMVVLGRLGKLPEKLSLFMGSLSAWTATLLFMWAPVSQMWLNFLNPANIKGLSVFTIVLAMIGNGLLLPRAIFTRDLMWSTGAAWGSLFQGWGILLSMYTYNCVGDSIFWGISAAVGLWISGVLFQDSRAYDLSSPFASLIELLSGSRKV